MITFGVLLAGPPGAGKEATFEFMHSYFLPATRTDIVEKDIASHRIISFDFTPLALGRADFDSRYRIQITAESKTENLDFDELLDEVDGVIFIANTSPESTTKNVEYLLSLRARLADLEIPIVYQDNKRDRLDTTPVDVMDNELDISPSERFETDANSRKEFFAPLTKLSKLMAANLHLERQ